MIAGRKAEYNYLQGLYESDENKVVVLYGREGIGKTTLVKDFCKDKNHFYYMAKQLFELQQKEMLGNEISEKYDYPLKEYEYSKMFSGFRVSDGKKLVVVIDEFEYISKRDESFLENIKALAAKRLYPGPVLIILICSSLTYIENDLKPAMTPKKAIIDEYYKVDEIPFVDIAKMFSNYDTCECVRLYGVIGGVPKYISLWDRNKDVKDNICRLMLRKDGRLYNEAERFVGLELRELSIYNTILYAIASGKRKLNDLYNYTGFSRAKISVYIKNLIELDIVEKVNSFETAGRENTQKGLYQISSTFVNFWYKFVFPHMSELGELAPEAFYDKYIANDIDEYLDRYFSKVCTEFLCLLGKLGRLPIKIDKIGSWIGKQGTIDIVAQNSKGSSIIGLCKWRDKVVTYDMYMDLLKTMEQAKLSADFYYLFASSQFDDKLKAASKDMPRLILVELASL